MPTLILGSTSRFRRALLDRLGLPYETYAPPFEENPPAGMAPREIARLFAEGKARSIAAGPDTWIIGCDQVPELEGRILRKTTSLDECRAQLNALSGKTHALQCDKMGAVGAPFLWRVRQAEGSGERWGPRAFAKACDRVSVLP